MFSSIPLQLSHRVLSPEVRVSKVSAAVAPSRLSSCSTPEAIPAVPMEDLHDQPARRMPEESAAGSELSLSLHVLPCGANVLTYCAMSSIAIRLGPLMLPLGDPVGFNLLSPLGSLLQCFSIQHTRCQLLDRIIDNAQAMRVSCGLSTSGAIILVFKPFREARPTEHVLISADSVCIQNQSLADSANVLLTQFFSLVLHRAACWMWFEDSCELNSVRPPGRVCRQQLLDHST
mmetsp:Transcript_28608/g.92280  ORF Transcript_28608/g.92280 Transcript_28608/m.92280 type:complete len:232 (+) Transcript_28608:280-975(+)